MAADNRPTTSAVEQKATADQLLPVVTGTEIHNLIYLVRGQQVMLDSDLAMLYQVETKYLNRAMKRNQDRFPADFCFQLTKTEAENLRCQIGTSSSSEALYGGRRYLPYVFTEQGISMLASVLHSDVAIKVSIGIMRTFVEMRKYLASSALLLAEVQDLKAKQIEYDLHQAAFEQKTEQRFEEIFNYIAEHKEVEQKLFFDGQIYDAFSLLSALIQKAEKKILLIDGYVDLATLNLLSKKRPGVSATIYTFPNTPLTNVDIRAFNAQYPHLTVKHTSAFHDRFLILDGTTAYHIGASLKDAGKKSFALNLLQDESMVRDLLHRLKPGATRNT